jgi:hypothetical protein
VALSCSVASAQGVLYEFPVENDSVSRAGDIDGDGHPDVLVGRSSGAVRVVSGATGKVIWSKAGPGSPATGWGAPVVGGLTLTPSVLDFVVAAPNGDPFSFTEPMVHACSWPLGFTLWVAEGPMYSRFGSALDGGPDLDGDGASEVLVGAPDEGSLLQGAAYLLSGRNGAVMRHHAGSIAAVGEFGAAVAFVGDLDGDAIADYAVGDPQLNLSGPGQVTVYSGASGALLRTLAGAGTPDAFGSSIARVDDVDGDGVGEVLVGAPEEVVAPLNHHKLGSASLFSGASGALIHKVAAQEFYELRLGASVAGLADYDGDGVPDFAVHHDRTWGISGAELGGLTRIYSGATGSELATTGIGLEGPIAAAGDVNLDQIPDLLVAGGSAASVVALGQCPAPEFYCTAKPSSLFGCAEPFSSFRGASSATVGPDLTLSVTRVPGQKTGILFWSNATAAVPFAGGWLCVSPPLVRLGPLQTGGTQGCASGALDFTFTKAYLASKNQLPGAEVFAQFWVRDVNATEGVVLSRGTRFTVWP